MDGGDGEKEIYGSTTSFVAELPGTGTSSGGNGGNDSVFGSGHESDSENDLYGGLGNDFRDGGRWYDSLDGGLGEDRISGGSGQGRLIGGEGLDSLGRDRAATYFRATMVWETN
jgi:Ca2+-binding RTX toxin-like protein